MDDALENATAETEAKELAKRTLGTLCNALDLGLRANCPVLSGNMYQHITSESTATGKRIVISAPYYDLKRFGKQMSNKRYANKIKGWSKTQRYVNPPKSRKSRATVVRVFKSDKRFASGDVVKDFNYAENVNRQGAFGGKSLKSMNWIDNTIKEIVGSLSSDEIEVIIDI